MADPIILTMEMVADHINTPGKYYWSLFYIIILLINILIAKLLFERFKKKKYQTIEEKTKLLQMMKDD